MDKEKKKRIINEILISGFSEYLHICAKKKVADDCTLRSYYFIQGLRDSIRTEKALQEKWRDDNELEQQIENMLATLSQYTDRNLLELKERYYKKSLRYYPTLKPTSTIKTALRRIFMRKRLLCKIG